MQLKQRLPKEGRDLLSGITSVEEAWEILGHHYGNKEMVIATVIQELLSARLTQGSAYTSARSTSARRCRGQYRH